jgi:hypothetical protein
LPVTLTAYFVYAAEDIYGSAGGTLTLGGRGGYFSETALDIPAGSMPGSRMITMGLAEKPAVGGDEICVLAVETGPDGLQFSSPVTVTIPVPEVIPADRPIDVRYYDTDTQTWSTDGIRNIHEIELPSGRAIQFDVTRLGLLGLVVPAHTDINESGQTDASDIQLVINAVLGVEIDGLSPDVNLDGRVDAADIQFTINSALGAN